MNKANGEYSYKMVGGTENRKGRGKMRKIILGVLMVSLSASLAYGAGPTFMKVKLGYSVEEQDKNLTFRPTSIGEGVVIGSSFSYFVDPKPDIGIRVSSFIANTHDFKIEVLNIYFDANDINKLISLLTEKYGSPIKVDKQQVQGRSGVFDRNITLWKTPDYEILVNNREPVNPLFGGMSVSTQKYLDFQKEKDKKAKDNL